MKKILFTACAAALIFSSCNGVGSKSPKTEIDTLSYAFGMTEIARGDMARIVDSTYNMNEGLIVQALVDALAGKTQMTMEEANAFAQEYFSVRMPANNLKEAEKFLADAEAKGALKTESGLIYEIIEEGSIKATNDADTVVVIYTGTLPDGTVFDSTEKHGTENDTFSLDRVIPAWTEGMKLVGIGGKVKIYAHPDLAYGAQGRQGIEGNKALLFDVEIVDVKPAAVVEEQTVVAE